MPCPRRHLGAGAAAPSQASWSRGRRRASSSLAVTCKAPEPTRPRLFTSALCPAACRRHHCHYCYRPADLRAVQRPQHLAAIGSRPAFVKEEELRLRNSMSILPQSPTTALTRATLCHTQERVSRSRLTAREERNLQRIRRHGILFPWPAVPPGQRCVPGLLEQPALSAQGQQQT